MEAKKRRLTLDMDPPVQRRLKVAAALKGVSMDQYCLTAIDKELAKDEANGASDQRSGPSDAERFAALRKEIFGDKVLPGSSVDLIREAREIREAQLRDDQPGTVETKLRAIAHALRHRFPTADVGDMFRKIEAGRHLP